LHHARLAEQTGVTNPVFASAMDSVQRTLAGSPSQAMAVFEHLMSTQAAMLGLNDIFWLSAVIFLWRSFG
jgi:DHA2 family multidrug resistance protein